MQGTWLQIPQPDHKGRVDMSKASLQFNPGPPPPLLEFEPSHFDSSLFGENRSGAAARAGRGKVGGRVLWRGMRTYRERAVLLACARNVGRFCPSVSHLSRVKRGCDNLSLLLLVLFCLRRVDYDKQTQHTGCLFECVQYTFRAFCVACRMLPSTLFEVRRLIVPSHD